MNLLRTGYLVIFFLSCGLMLSTCDKFTDERAEFVTPKPNLLISKVYFNTIDLVGAYFYNAENLLIKRVTYNPTSLLVSITQEYQYENKALVRADFMTVTAYQDPEIPDTSYHFVKYYYDELGWLNKIETYYPGRDHPMVQLFVYNSQNRLIEFHTGEIIAKAEIYDDCDYDNLWHIDPILYTAYKYDGQGNVILTTAISCGAERSKEKKYDDKLKPSDGLDYIPRNDFLPLQGTTGYSASLSVGNVIEASENETFQYLYNDKGYPDEIIRYYQGVETYRFLVEYIDPQK